MLLVHKSQGVLFPGYCYSRAGPISHQWDMWHCMDTLPLSPAQGGTST